MSKYKMNVLVCGGTGCKSSDSDLIAHNIKASLEEKGTEFHGSK